MAIEVFGRYENKCRIDGVTFRSVRAAIEEDIEPGKFNRSCKTYTIRNIYMRDSTLIRQPKHKRSCAL
jgi:hypothetical protein